MIDTYGRDIYYLRLSVTDKCNLRCRYCMPAEGICEKKHDDMLSEDEMIQAVEAAALLGFRKIRLTGGEPLVKKNILSICRRCKEVKGIEEVCLTTNAILLSEMAENLKEAGVDRINISLDTLNPQKYNYITRNGNLQKAIEGIEKALEVGFQRIKINAVLIGGLNDDEIVELASLTCKYPVDVRFIELMPMQDHDEFGEQAYVSVDAIMQALPQLQKSKQDDGVARLYTLPKGKGNIGLISALSSHFCASCNRIRLTADGNLKPCLHSNQEISIKGCNKEEMITKIKETILAKPACHAPLSVLERSDAGRNMNRIGG